MRCEKRYEEFSAGRVPEGEFQLERDDVIGAGPHPRDRGRERGARRKRGEERGRRVKGGTDGRREGERHLRVHLLETRVLPRSRGRGARAAGEEADREPEGCGVVGGAGFCVSVQGRCNARGAQVRGCGSCGGDGGAEKGV